MFRDKNRLVITGGMGALSTYGQNDQIIISTDTSFGACHVDVPFREQSESWVSTTFSPTVSDVNFNTFASTISATPISYNSSAPYCTPPLSLELLYFNANRNNESDAIVNWATIDEEEIDYFNIQRSENGEDWVTIAKTPTLGSGTTLQQYEYVDKDVYLPGTARAVFYYRLMSVDISGVLDYSQVRVVTFNSPDQEGSVIIQPNPAKDKFQFILYKPLEAIEGTTYNVVDVAGRILKTGYVSGPVTTVDMSGAASGMYFIRFSKNGVQNFKPQKIVVSK